MVVGADGGRPVVVNILRELPTQVGVFGGGRIARLLVFRALAFGARVAVLTHSPGTWTALRTAVPGPEWLSVLPPRSRIPAHGAAVAPSVIVDDTGVAADGLRRNVGPWQTVLSVGPRPNPAAIADLRRFDLLVLERLNSWDAEAIRTGCALAADTDRFLTDLPPDTVALVAAGRLRFARLTPTRAELAMR